MAEDDIYGNKRRYERFMERLEEFTIRPKITAEEAPKKRGVRKYYCKNPANLTYFKKLHNIFESRDNSYIRRLRVLRTLEIITFATEKDLGDCDREDINAIVAFSHSVNKSPKSKEDFINCIKFIWRLLFPERDNKGRIDDTIVPHPIRHLRSMVDKSKQKLRNDKLTIEEYEKIVDFFSDCSQMQCYITLATESLGRPQELCYRKIKDVELHENYAKIWVSSHGKEGVKFLQCIDSFPYFVKWYEKHPYKKENDAFLFMSNGKKDQPLTPTNLNKKIKLACQRLGIEKNITPYSLKRNGITFSRLQGDADVDIQHRAGWTSTKQLKTYDMSNGEDALKKQLAKRGLVKDKEYKAFFPRTKECICGACIGFAEKVCPKCKRLTDRNEIRDNMKAEKEIKEVFSFALKHPEMSFIEIMDEFRKSI